MSKSFLF